MSGAPKATPKPPAWSGHLNPITISVSRCTVTLVYQERRGYKDVYTHSFYHIAASGLYMIITQTLSSLQQAYEYAIDTGEAESPPTTPAPISVLGQKKQADATQA